LAPVSSGCHPLYTPARWIPHVTIGNLPNDQLSNATRELLHDSWDGETVVTQLALMEDTGETVVKRTVFSLVH
jgi:hypothetical protein